MLSTARRRAREREHRQQSILDAARRVFFEKGFSSARMDDVADQAEVSKGTLYRYFASKEALLAHLILEGLSMLLVALESEREADEPASAYEYIWNLARVYIGLSETHPDHFRLMLAFDCGRFEEAIPEKLNRQILNQSIRCLKVLEHAVQWGIASGEFAAADTWETAGILWATFTGVMIMMAHPVSPQVLAIGKEKMFHDTIELLLRALKQDATPSQD